MMQSPIKERPSKPVAYVAIMTALAAVIGYLEMLIPINLFGVPGVKLGFANIVSLIALYILGPVYALLIMIARVVIVGFMFGSMSSIIYGLTGGLFSVAVMTMTRKGRFSITGVSALGGVFHNIGQLLIAILFLKGVTLIYYLPVLVISGTVCGCLIGILAGMVRDRILGGKDDRILKGNS